MSWQVATVVEKCRDVPASAISRNKGGAKAFMRRKELEQLARRLRESAIQTQASQGLGS